MNEGLKDAGLSAVILITSKTVSGTDFFAYVSVPLEKFGEIEAIMKKPTFRPADIGTIIHSGEGKPSEDLKSYMETEYGFTHERMLKFP